MLGQIVQDRNIKGYLYWKDSNGHVQRELTLVFDIVKRLIFHVYVVVLYRFAKGHLVNRF